MNSMGKWFENVRVALTALLANKFRAALTTIGIGIGIAAVVILVSLGQAVQAYVTRQFLGVGADLIYVRPFISNNTQGPATGRSGISLSPLTEKDVALLEDPSNVPNVKAVVPIVTLTRATEFGPNQFQVRVTGATARYFEVVDRQVASGRLFDEQDTVSTARVAVLGQTTVKNLFEDVSPIGQEIRIGGISFRVIGTLQKSGGSGFGADPDDLIVIPITTAQARLQTERNISAERTVSQIYLQAADVASIKGVVASATEALRREHKVKPGKDADFRVSAQQDLLSSFDAVIALLTVFLAVIGGVSLLVGGIGVMNIMLVNVTERTREIGLRKAVGARAWDLLLQFLTEAIVLCFVGGFAGIVLAFAFITLLSVLIVDLRPTVSGPSIILAVSVTTLIGVFFGLYPASRAAALSPIQALRTE